MSSTNKLKSKGPRCEPWIRNFQLCNWKANYISMCKHRYPPLLLFHVYLNFQMCIDLYQIYRDVITYLTVSSLLFNITWWWETCWDWCEECEPTRVRPCKEDAVPIDTGVWRSCSKPSYVGGGVLQQLGAIPTW